jgi:hypothetical protein
MVSVSPYRFAVLPGKDEAGHDIFSVLAKRTYDIQPNRPVTPADKVRPFVEVDEYWDDGDPECSTVKYETDFVSYKIATDVVVIGKALAPGGKPVAYLDTFVELAGRKKIIRVFGDRKCMYRRNAAPTFTDPNPFTEMPIRYERAYGGKDTLSNPDLLFYYPRNQLGVGTVIKNLPETVDGLSLPNLEDPNDLLTPERIVIGEPERWNQQPLPAGFGWFQRTWYPRCSFVGAMPSFVDVDTVLREEQLGLVPKSQIALSRQFKLPSFEARFNSGASLGLMFPYLTGNESVRLANLTPEGSIVFQLPGETPRISLDIGRGENELKPVLHNVCVRLESMQVDLVWRGAHQYPGFDWLPEMKKMVAQIN